MAAPLYQLTAEFFQTLGLPVRIHVLELQGQREHAVPRVADRGRRGGGEPVAAAGRAPDAGSGNGCEVEIGAAFGPVYDVDRYGARLVAYPRHADALIVTGVVTRNWR